MGKEGSGDGRYITRDPRARAFANCEGAQRAKNASPARSDPGECGNCGHLPPPMFQSVPNINNNTALYAVRHP